MDFREKAANAASALMKPSALVMIFSISFAFWFNDLLKPYNPPRMPTNFAWDAAAYYSYLPATFYFNSYELLPGKDGYQRLTADSVQCSKCTYGVALLEAPWYFCGYWMAKYKGESLIGYSTPFADAIRFGAIVYLFIGMFYLRKYLLLFFSDKIVALTLLCILFGTLLYTYGLISVEMSHGFMFFLFSIFLWYCHRWHQRPTHGLTAVLAVILAVISIVRITEIYIFALFIFYGVKTRPEARTRFILFTTQFGKLFWFPLIAFLIWVPQMIVWKQCSGSFIAQLYEGERFYWNDPQVLNVLFSYRKGWLVYTPMAAFAFIGIFFMKRAIPFSRILFAGLLCLLIYVYSCWWDWSFGGCFGARAFCQMIAWLAIPLAAFFERVFDATANYFKHAMQYTVFALAFSAIFLNMGHAYQFQDQRLLHPTGMGREMYWNLFRTFQYGPDFINGYGFMVQPMDFNAWKRGENRDDKPEDYGK